MQKFSTDNLQIEADSTVIIDGSKDSSIPENGEFTIEFERDSLTSTTRGLNGGRTVHQYKTNPATLTIPFIPGSEKFIELENFFKNTTVESMSITLCCGTVYKGTGITYKQHTVSFKTQLEDGDTHSLSLNIDNLTLITKIS